jgi:signal transduction histidine kinase
MSSACARSGEGKPSPAESAELPLEKHAGYYEELLHTIERMQEDQDRRNVALAGAVHDLKTPLAVIAGFVNLLLGQKLGTVTARQLEALKDIAASCRRLDDAVGKLLYYAANDARTQTVSLEVTDINSCLAQIREMWTPVFDQKGVTFNCKLPTEVLRFAFDRQKIQQVISNLLENALKFTPAGGTVWLSAAAHFWDRRRPRQENVGIERRVYPSVRPNSARIELADTGPGISPEYHQDVFEEFFSLSRPGISPGIGLGLTIARHLVQAHQGKIWVENGADGGAKFCVLLPFFSTPARE